MQNNIIYLHIKCEKKIYSKISDHFVYSKPSFEEILVDYTCLNKIMRFSD